MNRPILVAYLNRLGVDFCPWDLKRSVGVFEGDTRTASGTHISIEDVLSDKWIGHLRKAGADWFIRILLYQAHGKPLNQQIVETIKQEAFKRLKKIRL